MTLHWPALHPPVGDANLGDEFLFWDKLNYMYTCRKRPLRMIVMLCIMAFGMFFSSMGSFASHGSNAITQSEVTWDQADNVQSVYMHAHDSDGIQRGHSGHHAADHFHETPERPPVIEIDIPHVADSWGNRTAVITPYKRAESRYRPPISASL